MVMPEFCTPYIHGVSNCDSMQLVPHKKLAPNPSDPKLNLVKQVLEEQHKIMSRLPKKYWLELGNKIPGLEAMQSILQAMQYAIFDTFLKCQTKVHQGVK